MRTKRHRDDNRQADRHQYHDEDLIIRHSFPPQLSVAVRLTPDVTERENRWLEGPGARLENRPQIALKPGGAERTRRRDRRRQGESS
jgi:hypothetical protein